MRRVHAARPVFVALFREAQHSRLPVYRETLDDPTGLIHIKDVLAHTETQPDGSFRWKDGPVEQFKRKLLFVPPSMPLLDLLLKMQTAHTHLALVIDEYGGTDGLVSIEDIIEEIVGDIADEHDEDVQQLRKSEDGAFVADARTDLEDFKEQTGIDLATGEDAEEVDTLGGLVVSLLGRVPQRGEIVAHPFRLRVRDSRSRSTPREALAHPRTAQARTGPCRDREARVTSALSRIGDTLRGLSGWRTFLTAIVTGAVSALGFAPFDLFPLLLLGFASLVPLLDGAARRPRPIRAAAMIGWGFGFGQFAAGMHWIFYPFLVDPVAHGWQMPFAALLFPGGLALFTAAACAGDAAVWRPGSGRASSRSRSLMRSPNGCAGMSSPAFPGICRPMAGARRSACCKARR